MGDWILRVGLRKIPEVGGLGGYWRLSVRYSRDAWRGLTLNYLEHPPPPLMDQTQMLEQGEKQDHPDVGEGAQQSESERGGKLPREGGSNHRRTDAQAQHCITGRYQANL